MRMVMSKHEKNMPWLLIYGAGAIGSLYAVLFSNAGYAVSVYARGDRLKALRENGLLYKEKGKVRCANVRVIDHLDDSDRYHFIFLTVRGDQAQTALKELKTNRSPCIVTMINTITNYAEWEALCGKGRILPAFPGAGGGFEDGVLEAALTPSVIQPTTFGEIDGKRSKRTAALAHLFRRSRIPYQIVPDMHAWQLSHLGLVVPLGDACVDYEPLEQVWKDWNRMYRAAAEIKRNFRWFAERGLLSPVKFYLVMRCPTSVAAWALRLFLKSDMGEMFGYKHIRKAPQEMKMLHNELYGYIRRYDRPE